MDRNWRNHLHWRVWTNRLGGETFWILILLLVVLGGSWGFVELADEVMEGDTQSFDERVVQSLRQPGDLQQPLGPVWLEEVGRDLTALGGVTVLLLVTAAVVGYLLLDGKYHAALFVLAAIGGGFVLTFALKSFFERPRPSFVPHLTQVYTASFPSGHAMLSAVVYLTLGALLVPLVARRLKIYVLTIALLLTLVVGLSRIYMGVHYPTDILAGWVAGLAWATLSLLLLRWLQRRGQAETAGEHGEHGELGVGGRW